MGDIHGCYDALLKILNHTINDDEFYIFCGDYTDRGIQNAEVLRFIFSIMDKKNVVFLEGNHERHLIDYINDSEIVSNVFKEKTQKEIELSGISKKKIKRFCDKLKEYMFFTYNSQKYFVCHGGVSKIPEKIEFLSSNQVIRGVGRYTDCEEVENNFAKNHPDTILIHGHRNVNHEPIKANSNCYNLENSVEFGGTLRMVSISDSGIDENSVINTVFEKTCVAESEKSISQIVSKLRNNEFIKEKQFDNVSSFNFTRNAFYNGIWNEQTIRARGLYIDTVKNKVVLRSYNKFFKIDETEETKMENLKKTLHFPINIYKKENGFLGLFSSYNGLPFFATKSSIDGDYNEYFKKIMYEKYGKDTIDEMSVYCNRHNVTFLFEVIDIINDPHIIKYNENKAILLDIVRNTVSKFDKYDYKDVVEIAKEYNLEHKKLVSTISNFKDFEAFVNTVSSSEEDVFSKIEGYVVEDTDGFMVKIKTRYYTFWKYIFGM